MNNLSSAHRHNIKRKYEAVYQTAYDRLNPEQRDAVNSIEGPVMVIAGPGTGKTQILAVRIGRILKETDTQPHNILCLTYTDAATISMRQRLSEIIGPDAHKVHIFTFHAFCNMVIQENLSYFGDHRQLEPITELEQIELFTELLEKLPDDHLLKRLKHSVQDSDIKRVKALFSLMKRENYDIDYINAAIDQYLADLRDDEKMQFKRGKTDQKTGIVYKAGDLNPRLYDPKVRSMDKLRAGAELFGQFQEMMRDAGRYDYDDMIQWVLRAFEADDEILMQYQERYHYLLVDEFQDTNGSQKRLLDLLVSFWADSPNLFAVGDDDQAIYKFQGANMGNILGFHEQYQPHVVMMTKNYRSAQPILDSSMGLINFNKERIHIQKPELKLQKDLEGMLDPANGKTDIVHIQSYDNVIHEQAALADYLGSKYEKGDDLSEIAILYRKHRQVEKLVEVLEKRGVPLNIKKKVDILKMPLIRNMLNILHFINDQFENSGYTDDRLFEMMHYNFFEIKSHDISKLIWTSRTERLEDGRNKLLHLISDKKRLEALEIQSIEPLTRLYDLIDKWIADMKDVTLQVLFQNIINEGHILNYILLRPNKTWLLQVLNTFFDLIKEETTKRPDLSLGEFLKMIDLMGERGVPLFINKVVSSEKGVHFLTAHSSKGLEYEEVIVFGATKDIWDGKASHWGSFSYPPMMNGDVELNDEDERRLMYVAMTRAKRHLTLSYSLKKEEGKETGRSQFVDELIAANDMEPTPQQVDPEVITRYQTDLLVKQDMPVELIDHDLIDRVLKGYKLSVTGLSKYLKCPITYYFESILRVPMARTKYLGFGRGVHYALECFFNHLSEEQHPSITQLLHWYDIGMAHHRAHFTPKEFQNMTTHGHQILTKYYEEYLEKLPDDVKSYQMEVKIDNAEYQGVPIKGVLDKVAIRPHDVLVTDFKTGKYKAPKLKTPDDKNEHGGDYWRQIVFYKILLDSDKKYNWTMRQGVMDFVEPEKDTNKFTQKTITVSDEHVRLVGEQITQVWEDIHDHKFEKGCGEDDCKWCNFVQDDYVIDLKLVNDRDWQDDEDR